LKEKVLFLNHNQENVGTYYRCLFLARGLSEHGFKVKMICASGRNFDLLIRTKRINPNFTIITLPRIKYHTYFTGQILRLFLTLPFTLFSHYDICHAFTVAQPQVAIPAWCAKVLRKKKLIIDWDDMWGGGFADEHNSLVAKILNWHERYFLQFADAITFVSERIGSEIKKTTSIYKKISQIPTFKIPNGANAEEIQVEDKQKCRDKLKIGNIDLLLSVGNTYTESLKIMLEAFEQVLHSRDNAFLFLVGCAQIPEEYQALYKRKKNKIKMVGPVPFSQVKYYLGAADVLLLPMMDNAIEEARFPMRLGDYLCAGRPIITNAVGEVKHYLQTYNAGLVSPPDQPTALASNILEALNNKILSHDISENARKLAEFDLNWKNIYSNLINVYESMVSKLN